MNKSVIEKGRLFNVRKATNDHWYYVALGLSEATITISLLSKNKYIAIDVYINNNKELYDHLFSKKDETKKS